MISLPQWAPWVLLTASSIINMILSIRIFVLTRSIHTSVRNEIIVDTPDVVQNIDAQESENWRRDVL